jgi:hypothetical protein
VNVRENALLERLNSWIGRLFHRDNVDRTVAALVASQEAPNLPSTRDTAKQRLVDAEARLRRFQAAIASGVDPAALVEAINDAHTERTAARAELDGTPAPSALTEAEIYAMIDSLGDVGVSLSDARPESLSELYRALRLDLRYDPVERAVDVVASPRVVSECVRGGTCTLTTRLVLGDAPVLDGQARLRAYPAVPNFGRTGDRFESNTALSDLLERCKWNMGRPGCPLSQQHQSQVVWPRVTSSTRTGRGCSR